MTFEMAALTLAGWVAGIPIGLLIAEMLSRMMDAMMDFPTGVHFEPFVLLWSFLIVMTVAVVLVQVPLTRATRMRPGEALRYQ